MPAFTMIETRFCPAAQKNVAIEVTQYPGGEAGRRCLSRDCGRAEDCRLAANPAPEQEKA